MKRVHVMVAVIRDSRQRILLSKRADHQHQGGLWEFPGGKLEAGETQQHGLIRELEEELGIVATSCHPLIQISHDYVDKEVFLDVWVVDQWKGEPQGREGQPIRWVDADQLQDYDFPAANVPIVTAVQLPDLYLVTPEPTEGFAPFLTSLTETVQQRPSDLLVQLRCHTLNDADYLALAREALAICRKYHTPLLLNRSIDMLNKVDAEGLHVNSHALAHFSRLYLDPHHRVSAACHHRDALQQAEASGVDALLISPVQATASHPGITPMGWKGFEQLVSEAKLPAYALGGMSVDDRARVKACGGQGIAAISSLWRM